MFVNYKTRNFFFRIDVKKDSADILKELLLNCDLIPESVKLLGLRKIQIKFQDYWDDSWILRVLRDIFFGFGGVEIYWPSLFTEPIIIY